VKSGREGWGCDRERQRLTVGRVHFLQLTRQNEDLRETKERMRAEIEGVNKQMDRKQRLLTGMSTLSIDLFHHLTPGGLICAPLPSLEVLERARTAESSVQTHLKDRKALETSTSKALNEMTMKLQEAQMVSTKSERESISLREGFQAYKEMQKKEVAEVKAELRALVERSKVEADEAVSRGERCPIDSLGSRWIRE